MEGTSESGGGFCPNGASDGGKSVDAVLKLHNELSGCDPRRGSVLADTMVWIKHGG